MQPRTKLVISPRIEYGKSGYTYASRLTQAWARGEVSRLWSLGSRPVSAQVRAQHGGGLWKCIDRLPDLTPELLDSLEAIGIEHPSSYADCYHQLAPKTRRLTWSYNAMFNWWSGGPWEEALREGVFYGNWYRYDLRSAYRWASTLGLPDIETFRAWKRFRRPEDANGLWVAYITPRSDLPNALRDAREPVVVSSEELRTYKLQADVIEGVTWDTMLPQTYVSDVLDRLPCPKKAGRAYWGRWIARDRLTCRTLAKPEGWKLPNRVANFVWGWLIIGRVRLRVWQRASHAAHVYVDELLVPHELPTGPNAGDWHLKEHFTRGVCVKRTGWYAALGGATVMQTGVAA